MNSNNIEWFSSPRLLPQETSNQDHTDSSTPVIVRNTRNAAMNLSPVDKNALKNLASSEGSVHDKAREGSLTWAKGISDWLNEKNSEKHEDSWNVDYKNCQISENRWTLSLVLQTAEWVNLRKISPKELACIIHDAHARWVLKFRSRRSRKVFKRIINDPDVEWTFTNNDDSITFTVSSNGRDGFPIISNFQEVSHDKAIIWVIRPSDKEFSILEERVEVIDKIRNLNDNLEMCNVDRSYIFRHKRKIGTIDAKLDDFPNSRKKIALKLEKLWRNLTYYIHPGYFLSAARIANQERKIQGLIRLSRTNIHKLETELKQQLEHYEKRD